MPICVARARRRRSGRGPALVGAALLALAAIALAGPDRGRAQQPEQLDGGTFRITAGDEPAVYETFAIRREGDRLQSAARVSAGMGGEPGAGRILREFRLQLDPGLQPTFFELSDRTGGERGVVGVRSGNRIQLRARSPEGERWQELLLAPGIVVLPEGLAHPYYFVMRKLEGSAEPPLPVIRPDAGLRRSLTVEARSSERITIAGTEISATRLDLRIGDGTHRVWIDDRGRVLQVVVPGRSWSAVRVEPPASN